MEDLHALIVRAQAGDVNAYEQIVCQFQNMAVGYGYAILGDIYKAEDAAQEAFLQAYCDLPSLQEPLAFAGWLRRIVFKYCNRITRRHTLPTISLDAMQDVIGLEGDPPHAAEEAALRATVRNAIACLPQHERVVTALFYIGDYSQQEIAGFLGVPVTTVKKRLQAARQKLKQRMIAMVADDLHAQAPSRDEQFVSRVQAAVNAIHTGDLSSLQTLVAQDPALSNVRSTDGRTLLNHLTDYPGRRPAGVAMARLLLSAGADVNARAIDPEAGETSLQWAVSSGDVEMAEVLLDAGALVDGADSTGRPLAQALFYGNQEAARLLVQRGARISLEFAAGLGDLGRARRFFDPDGRLKPEAGRHCPPVNNPISETSNDPRRELLEQALVYACINGQIAVAAFLLRQGTDVNALPAGFDVRLTGLHWAVMRGQKEMAAFLIDYGADIAMRDPQHNATHLRGPIITGRRKSPSCFWLKGGLKMSDETTFIRVIPKLAALDIGATMAFYEQLGFTKRSQYDDYGIVLNGNLEIHFWLCNDKHIADNTGCRVEVKHITALHERYKQAGVIHPNGDLQTTPWNTQEFSIVDLNGNLITFFEHTA